jgi:U-box domain/Sel1 repeat
LTRMRIFRTLLLPASEFIDFICETIHYPFIYAFLYFLLSQPWKEAPKPPIEIDDGFPKAKKRDIRDLLDRLTGDQPLEKETFSSDNPYIEKEETKINFATNDAANDLICPLTLELPFDPVTAEDGQVYERVAIEEYFKNNPLTDDNKVQSPVTNELIGQRYLPAPRYKKIIETLIKNGVITGTLAEKWEERALHKEHMDDMLNMAQQGVVMEMLAVACNYLTGEGDFKEDAEVAFKWFERAHEAGSPIGTAGMGLMLTRGVGAAKDPEKGLEYLLMAGKRSDFAAFMLGLAYADGKLGFSIDTAKAGVWLGRCLDNSCAQRHMTVADKCMAQQKLEEILQR